eukprot:NODE_372_length_3111_cov_8.802279.p1 GENE.NODE_372_length_3111_cov_8.802279~~NODE_372_length_3111_cov_8.802279.p1  ORF type:complete len:799 (-),score=185.11 NODE_372_length_3111_cov_8.802279:702-3098(-)
MDAASKLAKHWGEKTNDTVQRRAFRVTWDAQEAKAEEVGGMKTFGVQDGLANIIYTAPAAACDVLESMLKGVPLTEDAEKHWIWGTVTLWGLIGNPEMKCQYKADFMPERGSGFGEKRHCPAWLGHHDEHPKWHSTFIVPEAHGFWWHIKRWICCRASQRPNHVVTGQKALARHDYVHECDVKVMFMPDILDVDIMWALASTWVQHLHIFSKLSVMGLVNGMWQGLCTKTFYADLILTCIELSVVILWGLDGTKSWHWRVESSSELLGKRALRSANLVFVISVCFTVAGATIVREAFFLFFWWWQYDSKRRSTKDAKNNIVMMPEPEIIDGPQSNMSESLAAHYATMYTSANLWNQTSFSIELLTFVFLVVLVVMQYIKLHQGTAMVDDMDDMPFFVVLAVNILLRFFKLFHICRGLDGSGAKIIAIWETNFTGAVFEILLVTITFFVMCWACFATLLRDERLVKICLYLYRGMMFGDGGGMDTMKLAPALECNAGDSCTQGDDDVWAPQSSNLVLQYEWFTIGVGTIFCMIFNICILNLLIAVYGNEYDDMEVQSKLYFMRQRARMNCKYYWALEIFKPDHKWTGLLYCMPFACWEGTPIVGCIAFTPFVAFLWPFMMVIFFFIPSYYSMMREMTSQEEQTAVASPDREVTALICSVLLGFGQILLFAWTRHGNWIDHNVEDRDFEKIKDREKNKKKSGGDTPTEEINPERMQKFLWICHRKDFTEAIERNSKATKSNIKEACTDSDFTNLKDEWEKVKQVISTGEDESSLGAALETLEKDARAVKNSLSEILNKIN